jgi:hypothetical protein
MEEGGSDLKSLIFKIFMPALVALSIKLAIQNGKKKVTIFQVISSFITGIGSAYLFSELVMSEVTPEYIPLVIAVITISGEKIGHYLVYKLDVENVIKMLVEKYKK